MGSKESEYTGPEWPINLIELLAVFFRILLIVSAVTQMGDIVRITTHVRG
jgi:hypothetical protein